MISLSLVARITGGFARLITTTATTSAMSTATAIATITTLATTMGLRLDFTRNKLDKVAI